MNESNLPVNEKTLQEKQSKVTKRKNTISQELSFVIVFFILFLINLPIGLLGLLNLIQGFLKGKRK